MKIGFDAVNDEREEEEGAFFVARRPVPFCFLKTD